MSTKLVRSERRVSRKRVARAGGVLKRVVSISMALHKLENLLRHFAAAPEVETPITVSPSTVSIVALEGAKPCPKGIE